jgi:hypothetical protein
MKNLSLIIILLSVVSVSCKKEGCTDIAATNYNAEAKKDDGSCTYPNPTPDPRAPYLGTYTCLDSMDLLGSFDHETNYTLEITTGGTLSDTLLLKNLWGDGADYFCTWAGTSITIYSQQVSGPYYTEGSGSLANSAISYSTSGDAYVHTGTGTKD